MLAIAMNDPLRIYRHRWRAWRNERRIARERRYYADRFSTLGLSLPDDATIRDALDRAVPGRRPKRRGDLSILALYPHYNWENYALKPALEKFGRVRHYDWCAEFDHQRPDWHKGVRARMNEALVDRVRTWVKDDKTDVIFTYLTGALITTETAAALHSLAIPMVNLSLNDKEYFVGRIVDGQAMGLRDICRSFHLSWTSTEDALIKYRVEGGTPIYLPEGANPDIHRPCDVERIYDVTFVGQRYGNRPAVIETVRRAGIDIRAFGPGWPAGPLPMEDMVRLYSQSRVSLGFGGVASHKDTFCLKGRDFEIPMSGGLYLTEHHPELEKAYRLGEEIVTYKKMDDLIDTIRHLLAHPDEAERIRRAGHARALADHTWEMRFETVFHLLGVLKTGERQKMAF